MLRIASATLALCLSPAAVFAVSDGHFDTARQGCEKSDYTYDQKDVDHPGDGCETITAQGGPAESNDFVRSGIDHATIVDLGPRSTSGAPLNLAHRGTGVNTAANPYPENTLASFIHAVDVEGADGVELDVQVALNNGNADPFDELVLMHDESLNRTTTCRSPLPVDDCAANRTSEDIRVSCVPLNGSGETERAGIFDQQVVPTLREALDAIVRGRGKYVNIEIKNQPPTDPDSQREGCNSGEPLNVSSLAIDLLVAEYTAAERALVILSSFNPFAAAAAKHEAAVLGAPLDVGLLVIPLRDAASPQFPDATYAAIFAAAAGLDAIHPHEKEATAEAVGFARSLGLAVRPWTVNERCGMRRLIDLGVDAIITDEPDRLAAELVTPSICP
ncbi:MAG: glycerophosphodiester phosphodiesterase [Candidatus Binatia bacterium]